MKPSRKRRFFFVHFAQKSCYNIYAGGNSEYILRMVNPHGRIRKQRQGKRGADSFEAAHNDLVCVKNELYGAIRNEAEKRCCGDNSIVTYANATFYPKQVADVTTGTATTAQPTYNPIPKCGCGCGCGCN